MARNEEGEFELVVGTRQLLTLVFILMVLFGVVFSMGYSVGRSTGPEAPPVSAAVKPPVPEPSEPGPGGAGESGGRPFPGGPVSPAGERVATPVPSQAPTPPTQLESAPPPATAAVKPPSTPEAKPAAAPAAPPPSAAQPAAGQTFLQVAAVKRPEAELIAEVLKKKGFPTLTAPVPGDTLYRVLVGPIQDTAAIAKTKADLEQAGFRSILRKY